MPVVKLIDKRHDILLFVCDSDSVYLCIHSRKHLPTTRSRVLDRNIQKAVPLFSYHLHSFTLSESYLYANCWTSWASLHDYDKLLRSLLLLSRLIRTSTSESELDIYKKKTSPQKWFKTLDSKPWLLASLPLVCATPCAAAHRLQLLRKPLTRPPTLRAHLLLSQSTASSLVSLLC